jgi:hypothetical protein
MITYSLACLPARHSNLEIIIPAILPQCDRLIVHLNESGFTFPKILRHTKILIFHSEDRKGSEIRFRHIPKHGYFFSIDDDICYPADYTDRHLKNLKKDNDNILSCVHFANLTNKNYLHRKILNFKRPHFGSESADIAGTGTIAFNVEKFNIDYNIFKTKNMSDAYVSVEAWKQKIEIVPVKREANWLTPMNEYGEAICGKNPIKEINELINENWNSYPNKR